MNSGRHPLCQMALIEDFPFSWMVYYGFIQIGLRWSYYEPANHLHWDIKIALCLSSKLSLGPFKLHLICEIIVSRPSMVLYALSGEKCVNQSDLCTVEEVKFALKVHRLQQCKSKESTMQLVSTQTQVQYECNNLYCRCRFNNNCVESF